MLQSWDHHHSLMWKASQKRQNPTSKIKFSWHLLSQKFPSAEGSFGTIKGTCIFVPAAPKAKLAMPGIKALHIGCCLESRIMLVFFSGGALSFNNDATLILCLQFVYIHKDITYRYNIYILYARSLTLCIFSIYSIYIQR